MNGVSFQKKDPGRFSGEAPMLNRFTRQVRTTLLAAILAFAALSADAHAAGTPLPIVATATTPNRSKHDTTPTDDGIPVGGILIVLGIVGGIILLAWIASRMSDNRSPMS
jgi:hypothetical protein